MARIAAGIVAKEYVEVLPPQDVLARRLGVSRSVVREAVTILSARGMVQARPKIGTCVRPSSDWCIVNEDVLRWRSLDAPNSNCYSIEKEGDAYGLYVGRTEASEGLRLASLSGATAHTARLITIALEALTSTTAARQVAVE